MSVKRAVFNIFASNLKDGGVSLPQTMTDEIAKLDPLRHNSGPERVDNALVAAVAAAYIEGRDPAGDKSIQALVERQALATALPNWPSTLDTWEQDRLGTIVAAYSDDIMQACATAVTAAGQELAGACELLDATQPLTAQAETALRRGPAAGEAWRTASAAVAKIDAITQGQGIAAQMVNRSYHAQALALLLRCPTVPVATYEVALAQRSTSDTWRLASEYGLTIAGADFYDVADAQERIALERTAAESERSAVADKSYGAMMRFR